MKTDMEHEKNVEASVHWLMHLMVSKVKQINLR